MANSIGVTNQSKETLEKPVQVDCISLSQGPPILDPPYEHQSGSLNDNTYHPTIDLCEEENVSRQITTLPILTDFDVEEFIRLCEEEEKSRSSSLAKNGMTSCASNNTDQVLQKASKTITINNCQNFTIHM
jgi:hypothetical protein